MMDDRDRCYLFASRGEWLARGVDAHPGTLDIVEVGAPERVVSIGEDGEPAGSPRDGWRVDILLSADVDPAAVAALDPWRTQPGSRLHVWL